MKRALSMVLTVVLISSLAFAGSAAAFDINQDADANAIQQQSMSQSNYAAHGNNFVAGDGDSSVNIVDQSNGNAKYTEAKAENNDDYQAIGDNDLADPNVNAGNVNTATAVNAGNLGGDQTAVAEASQDNFAGDIYEIND